ncbi:MAG: DUF2959 domain-containing protein [Pseudomonadales bacterium]|nr:DUF2959 domain-containing protein [Pseudomonadales bacterium]
MIKNLSIVALALCLLSGCESAYFNVMEKVGIPKRDILIDRIEDAQETQVEGQQQFKDALEQFKAVVNFEGGELEEAYNRLNDEYEDSVDAAEKITDRIDKVESVADALFEEWQGELDQYTSPSLRRDSERQLKATRKRYETLIGSMRKAERSIEPVLAALKDNVLYLKHNLNARAIASLKGEFASVNTDVNALISQMQKAIDESNRFITDMRQ